MIDFKNSNTLYISNIAMVLSTPDFNIDVTKVEPYEFNGTSQYDIPNETLSDKTEVKTSDIQCTGMLLKLHYAMTKHRN